MVDNLVDDIDKKIAELEAKNVELKFLQRKKSVLTQWRDFSSKISSLFSVIDDYGLTRVANIIASGQELVSNSTPAPPTPPTPAPPVVEEVVVEEVVEEVVVEEVDDEEYEYEEVEVEEEETE